MRRLPAPRSRLRLTASRGVLLCSLLASGASAQVPVDPDAVPMEPAAAPPGAGAAPPEEGVATPPGPAVTPEEVVAPTAPTAAEPSGTQSDAELAALKAALAQTRQQLDEVIARQDAAEAAAAEGSAAPEQEALSIYGFADMGVQRQWVEKSSLVGNLFPTNSTSFVIGNVNLYFDAQPVEHWRGLVELRFTNAPQGDIQSLGGIAGTFQREDTFSYDPHGTAPNAPMWAGSVVLERAWIEYNELQSLKLRVGNWFTPFGIWNEDHGTPTLIALALPQFILQRWIPIRQTGLKLYGNAFAGTWELGYALTLSNGRQELSNFNFEDKFGYGGRLYARRDTGTFNTTFGLSYFTGTTSDETIDVTGVAPVTFATQKTWEYDEHVLGVDVAIDIDSTRIRAEGLVRRQVFTPGHRVAGDPVFAPGSLEPNKWQHGAYLLVAHQLPWGGVEPYLWGEVMQTPSVVGDGLVVVSAGVNVHFNASIQLKAQIIRGAFFDWAYDSTYDVSTNDITALYSRIVMAF